MEVQILIYQIEPIRKKTSVFPLPGFKNSCKLATSKITNEYSPLKSNTL